MSDQPISRLSVPNEQMLPEDIQTIFAEMRTKPGFSGNPGL